MKAIDEAKVKAITQELKGKAKMLVQLMLNATSDDTREALVEDMVDIERIIVYLNELEDIPDDAWILNVRGDE